MNGGNTTTKSALTAGVLAIFLGAFGVHDWYLDNTKKAKRHLALAITWLILLVISIILRTFAPSTGNLNVANIFNSIATTANVLSWIAIVADVIWGIIEGVLLLVQGDSGLSARGYNVASPANTAAQSLSPTTLSNASGAANSANPAAPNPADAANSAGSAIPSVQTSTNSSTPAQNLPPAPTLAEQALGANPQPVVFNSANIQQSTSLASLSQPLGTKTIPAPALTVQNSAGKTTINPTILRKILISGVVIIAAIIIAVIVKNGISSTLAAGYGATYRVARELSPKITSAAASTSCEYAVAYVKSANVDKPTYGSYITNCKTLASGTAELVEQLGQTPAIGWNSELSGAYQDFRTQYFEAFPGGEAATELSNALDLYQTWHDYLLATDLLNVDSPDADFQQAADILRTSGNDTLAKYGEEWLTKELDYLATYRAYWNLSYTDPGKDALRAEVETKRDDLRNWVNDHRPDVTRLANIAIPDTSALQASFSKLYELIKSAYESHYDSSSNDCNQAGSAVYCS